MDPWDLPTPSAILGSVEYVLYNGVLSWRLLSRSHSLSVTMCRWWRGDFDWFSAVLCSVEYVLYKWCSLLVTMCHSWRQGIDSLPYTESTHIRTPLLHRPLSWWAWISVYVMVSLFTTYSTNITISTLSWRAWISLYKWLVFLCMQWCRSLLRTVLLSLSLPTTKNKIERIDIDAGT